MNSALPRTAGNENTGLIKLIAIACMIVDHTSVVFFPGVLELRLIGRVAFPLFVWCLCVGAEYTRNIWKYVLRLLIVGILAQPVYVWTMGHSWKSLNVFFELLIGLFAIAAIRENRLGSRYWGPALALAAVCALDMNYSYGWQGITLILLLYACRKNRIAIAAVMTAFCLYWGQGTTRLTTFCGLALPQSIPFLPGANRLLMDISRVQFWAILALPLIAVPMKGRLRVPKWIPYLAYPLHLLALGVIRHWNELTLMIR